MCIRDRLKIYYPKKETSQNANQGAAFSAHVEIAPVNVNSSVINAPKGWNEAKAVSYTHL